MGTSAKREVLELPVVEMCSEEKELQVAVVKKNGNMGTRTEEVSTPETELEESVGPYETPW